MKKHAKKLIKEIGWKERSIRKEALTFGGWTSLKENHITKITKKDAEVYNRK